MKRKRGRPKGSKNKSRGITSVVVDSLSGLLERLQAAKKFVDSVGGIEKAMQLLESLKKIGGK